MAKFQNGSCTKSGRTLPAKLKGVPTILPPKNQNRDSSSKRPTICPLCEASSFHRPNDLELKELQGYSVLKSPEVLKLVKARGICERHWEINIQGRKSDRPRKFTCPHPLISKLGPKFLPSTPSFQRSRRLSPLANDPEGIPALLPPGQSSLNDKSNQALRAALRRLEKEAENNRRELVHLRAQLGQRAQSSAEAQRALVLAEQALATERSWSISSLDEKHQLPLLMEFGKIE